MPSRGLGSGHRDRVGASPGAGGRLLITSRPPRHGQRSAALARAFAALVAAAAASPARGQAPAGLQLDWRAPAECPRAEDALARVHDYLGRATDPHVAGAISAVATVIRRSDGRYELVLRLEGGDGPAERTLSADGCDAVMQAGALLIAMALDPELQLPHSPVEPPPSPALTAPAPAPVPPAKPEPAAAQANPVPRTPGRLDAGVGALAELGDQPGLAFGIAAEVAARLAAWRLALGAAFLPATRGAIAELPNASVTMATARANARLCLPLLTGPVELGPCGLLELGTLRGRVHGIRLPHSADALWLAVGAGARGRFALGGAWGLVADAGAVAPLARQRFVVQTDGGSLSVHRVAPVAIRFGLGMAYEFK
jgi:hypothetical protein